MRQSLKTYFNVRTLKNYYVADAEFEILKYNYYCKESYEHRVKQFQGCSLGFSYTDDHQNVTSHRDFTGLIASIKKEKSYKPPKISQNLAHQEFSGICHLMKNHQD